jgi:aryl-alcohol dehydrogenase (NADP+)
VVIATKVFFPASSKPNRGGLSRKHIFDAIDGSLSRLGTDHVDLYQIHRWDPETPIEETLEALHDVVRAGKARYIGASSMFAWQLAKSLYIAQLRGWTRFVSMQNHYNLVYREEEREMMPLCRDQGLGVIPWSPLARGLLTGTRRPDLGGQSVRSTSDDYASKLYDAADYKVVERVVDLAKRRGLSPAQVALAWLLHQDGVTAPIIGATRLEHVDEAVAASGVSLEAAELAYLEEPYVPHPIRGHD